MLNHKKCLVGSLLCCFTLQCYSDICKVRGTNTIQPIEIMLVSLIHGLSTKKIEAFHENSLCDFKFQPAVTDPQRKVLLT
jgi:hypothetical protein